jgi:hypothetical protein
MTDTSEVPPDALTVALDTPSARLLADQAATIQDLQFVMESCKRLLTELAKPRDDRDALAAQALWSAALVAYGRCFGNGRQFGLTADDIRSLPLKGEVMKYHKWVLAERNRHTTHPKQPFEMAQVGAALSPPGAENRQVAGVAVMSRSRVLVDDTGVRQLGALAAELARQTADRARAQQDETLADAQRQDIDRLYELPPLAVGPPGEDGSGR